MLLPVRNGAALIPDWLDAIRGLADSVIALDDGSTDGTAELLAGDPLVVQILENPTREGFAGWNEPRDRQRLLDAASALQPRFVLFLDSDERIDTDDASALREFLEHDALPRIAYGFQVFRMLGEASFDRAGLWVYRLFTWEPGQHLAMEALRLLFLNPHEWRAVLDAWKLLPQIRERRRREKAACILGDAELLAMARSDLRRYRVL